MSMSMSYITPSYDFSRNKNGYDRHQSTFIGHAIQGEPTFTNQFSSAWGDKIYHKIVETLAQQDDASPPSHSPSSPSILTPKLQALDLLLSDILTFPHKLCHVISPLYKIDVNPLGERIKATREQLDAEERKRKQEEGEDLGGGANGEEEKQDESEIKTLQDKHQYNSVFAELVLNSTSSHGELRERCTRCLAQIASLRQGREWCVSAEILPRLAKLMLDIDRGVRWNVARILLYMTESQHGINTIIQYHMLDILIDKCVREEDLGVRNLCLCVIIPCLRLADGWAFAMGAGVVNTLAKMLHALMNEKQGENKGSLRDRHAVLSHACQCIAYIAVHNKGKDATVTAGLVPMLVTLLDTPDIPVREHAAAAIMNITIAQSGKIAAISCHAIPKLIAHLTDESDCVIANSMQALASIVEHPNSKKNTGIRDESTIAVLRKATTREDSSLVRTSAKTALDKILWEP